MTTFTPAEIAGIVIGGLLAALFVSTCLISLIKAVQDRKKIKSRIEEKKRARLLASELKKSGQLEAANASIEDPEFFVRNGFEGRSNTHQVVNHSASCPPRAESNGANNSLKYSSSSPSQAKRNSEPSYRTVAEGAHSIDISDRPHQSGRRKGRKQSSQELMSSGVYRYRGDPASGMENAAFELRENNRNSYALNSRDYLDDTSLNHGVENTASELKEQKDNT